jgi:hypothetical protein
VRRELWAGPPSHAPMRPRACAKHGSPAWAVVAPSVLEPIPARANQPDVGVAVRADVWCGRVQRGGKAGRLGVLLGVRSARCSPWWEYGCGVGAERAPGTLAMSMRPCARAPGTFAVPHGGFQEHSRAVGGPAAPPHLALHAAWRGEVVRDPLRDGGCRTVPRHHLRRRWGRRRTRGSLGGAPAPLDLALHLCPCRTTKTCLSPASASVRSG